MKSFFRVDFASCTERYVLMERFIGFPAFVELILPEVTEPQV